MGVRVTVYVGAAIDVNFAVAVANADCPDAGDKVWVNGDVGVIIADDIGSERRRLQAVIRTPKMNITREKYIADAMDLTLVHLRECQ